MASRALVAQPAAFIVLDSASAACLGLLVTDPLPFALDTLIEKVREKVEGQDNTANVVKFCRMIK